MTMPSEDPVRRWTLRGWSPKRERVRFDLSSVEPGPSGSAERVSFWVNEKEHVIWDHEIHAKNLEFLRGFDPGYFRHVAELYSPLFKHDDEEERQRAAAGVRLAYSVALETFFALLATAIQAPKMALGWMLKYRNADLEALLQKLYSGETVHSAWPDQFSWTSFAAGVHQLPFDAAAVSEEDQLIHGFARAWRRFAGEFLDQDMSAEYNSLKHGLRARVGGFTLSVALPEAVGVPPVPEAWTPPSGSSFGSAFYALVGLGEQRNWAVRKCSRNWVPDNMIAGLVLLSISINNIVWFLRAEGGDSTPQQFQRPSDFGLFHAPWAVRLEWDQMDEHPMLTSATP